MSNNFKKKKSEAKAPAGWLMTYADLMSLLMAFFVLLLSFSEMDLQKYKQVSGAMKEAFGVQREIKTMEIPKGTSIIAQNFSPGRPSPSVLNVMRQDTIDETKQTLNFTDALMEKKDGKDIDDGEVGDRSNRLLNMQQTTTEVSEGSFYGGNLSDEVDAEKVRDYISNNMEEEQKKAQTIADLEKILEALKEEIKRGMIQVESEGTKILIRIREKGSFPSGSATFKQDFLPVLAKLRKTLASVTGKVLIAGHTDNVPINTSRFRSNWELSSSRAVSVVHELLKEDILDPGRFLIEGHGEAHPIKPNDTPENRAINRRVELTIVQGDNEDEASAKEFEEMVNDALAESLEVSEIPFVGDAIEQTALSDKITIPEVSIDHLKHDGETHSGTEQKTGEITPETKPEISPSQNDNGLNINSIEERIRRFSEKMEKHKEKHKK